MKKILMIGTGGTIASKETGDGLAPGLTTEELLSFIPEVKDVCHVETTQIFSVDSTNMTPDHWLKLVEAVEKNYDAYDGFVISHGTDTLAYTAAALSYLIQNSRKPIVITGAQKPIDMDVTDARTNLLDSFIYASDDASQDVTIVFDGKVIVGTRAKKTCAKSYDAFSSINFPCPAVIQDKRVVRYIPPAEYKVPVKFYHAVSDSICVMKMIPGIKPKFLSYMFENYDCIVLETFGVGGIPQTILKEFYHQMETWKEKGKHVVIATQVANEGSNMEVYEVGQKVKQDFNLTEAYDMTLEATITKMMWLMALPDMTHEDMREAFYGTINSDILMRR